MTAARGRAPPQRWAWRAALLLHLTSAAVAGTGGKWFLVAEDNLARMEAFEYAILRINEMRTECEGFHLAPLMMQNYRAPEVYKQRHDLYTAYRLRIEPTHKLAPFSIEVSITQLHSVNDLSLFEVTKVKPPPCDLYSAMDDAELMVSWKAPTAQESQKAAIELLNRERSILCPDRPQLQLQRLVAASQQPAQGYVMRLVLEMREAAESFQTESFVDVVQVSYVLDQEVPEQSNKTPEIYPARPPCKMRFTSEEQNEQGKAEGDSEDGRRRLRGGLQGAHEAAPAAADEADAAEAKPPAAGGRWRSLRQLRREAAAQLPAAAAVQGRRLSASLVDAAPSGTEVEQRFADKGLDIPDDFDPRLRRTLCFPRGFSRQQGSCGSSFAFAATSVAAFRECLWQLDQGDESAGLRFFSAQELTSCDGQGDGCAGGSAPSAFYFMKHDGVSRESCSPYRMRCFNDNSGLSQTAADSQTSQHRSKHFDSATSTCPLTVNAATSPCKCLPSVFHLSKPVECQGLPHACPRIKIPHYFYIAGTAEGSTIPLFELHMMQELLIAGPLYVSLLLYADFYDSVSWTESGIYVHKRGGLIGKHAAAAVGWGSDADNRKYWLLLNSFGNGWRQEGYFKILRGETALEMTKFGAWGSDWKDPEKDKSKPTIADVEISFSPVLSDMAETEVEESLAHVYLMVSAFTDEDARVLVRIQGLSNTVTAHKKDTDFKIEHVLKLDLLKEGLLDDDAKVQIWAVDRAENTATWGPFTLNIPSRKTFRLSQARRLATPPSALPVRHEVSNATRWI